MNRYIILPWGHSSHPDQQDHPTIFDTLDEALGARASTDEVVRVPDWAVPTVCHAFRVLDEAAQKPGRTVEERAQSTEAEQFSHGIIELFPPVYEPWTSFRPHRPTPEQIEEAYHTAQDIRQFARDVYYERVPPSWDKGKILNHFIGLAEKVVDLLRDKH